MTCPSSSGSLSGDSCIRSRFTGSRHGEAEASTRLELPFSNAIPARHPAFSLGLAGDIEIKEGGIYLARVAVSGSRGRGGILPALAVNGSPLPGAVHGPQDKRASSAYQLVSLHRNDRLSLLDLSAPLQKLLEPSPAEADADSAGWMLILQRLGDQNGCG